jgi:hypothetical protein
VADNEKPFATPPSRGTVPFLSMPNVGDVMTDRTNTQGHEGYVAYDGPGGYADPEIMNDLKSIMKERYENDLKSARESGEPASIIEHYEDMIRRYKAK